MEPSKFKEAILKDPDFGEAGWKDIFEAPAVRNPVYQKALKQGLYSDVAGALGGIQASIVAAAFPNLIARLIVKVIQTGNAIERFPKEYVPVAYETGEAPSPKTGMRAEMQDIKVNKEIECSQSWSQSYVEDASWNVLATQIAGIGRAIARKELKLVYAMYGGIANASLASGAEKTITDGAPTWAQICDLINAVETEDFRPSIIAMNSHEFGGLRKLTEFTSSLYVDRQSLGARNAVYHTALDVTFVSSSEISKTLAIDIDAASVMLLRRDLTSKPYESPAENKFGVHGSERLGLDVLRTKAVARGTN
jgi:hypothetical protein